MNSRPRFIRAKRYSLNGAEARELEMPTGQPLILPLLDWGWLPTGVHQLVIQPDGDVRPLATEFRARPARVPLLNGRALSFRRMPQRVTHGDCVSFNQAITAEFFTTEHHDPALEAALSTDAAARAVWADALEEAGDPLGEAIALAGAEAEPAAWVTNSTRLPMLELDAAWKAGFADEAQVSMLDSAVYPGGILRVLGSRLFCALSSLTVRIDVARAIEHPLDARLARHLPRSLREFQLVLGQRDSPPRSEVDALLAAVRAQCSNVEATVAVDPNRAEPSAERIRLNLRGGDGS